MRGWWFPSVHGQGVVLDCWRQHPCRLVGHAVPALLAGAGWLFFSISSRSPVIELAFGALSVLLTLRLAWHVIEWLTNWVVVTDRQVMRASGFFSRHTATLLLEHVGSLDHRRPVLGRVLGYGDWLLESVGRNEAGVHLRLIPNPESRYVLICGLLAKSAAPPSPGVTVS
ncbi:MAG: PH domain-containing protein [Egibacteraceae bacterium]